jgi:hypothetical protein
MVLIKELHHHTDHTAGRCLPSAMASPPATNCFLRRRRSNHGIEGMEPCMHECCSRGTTIQRMSASLDAALPVVGGGFARADCCRQPHPTGWQSARLPHITMGTFLLPCRATMTAAFRCIFLCSLVLLQASLVASSISARP